MKLTMQITKIPMDAKNRMIRLGGGLNDGKWFVRIDLWVVGYRLTSGV